MHRFCWNSDYNYESRKPKWPMAFALIQDVYDEHSDVCEQPRELCSSHNISLSPRMHKVMCSHKRSAPKFDDDFDDCIKSAPETCTKQEKQESGSYDKKSLLQSQNFNDYKIFTLYARRIK